MDFGKNRIQYGNFYWQYFRFDKFDTYYYVDGKELAEYVSMIAYERIPELEEFFQYTLDKRVIFVVYNKLADFRQSNIGLVTGQSETNIGGVTAIINNKIFIYFDGNHENFEKQINKAITEVILNQLLYGSGFTDRLANSTLLNLPDWYYKGLVSYASNGWDIETDNKVKDGILDGRYDKFNRLTGEEAIYAGHSLWNYIGNTYGKSVIPNIVYLARVSKNIDNGFLFVLGTSLNMLTKQWLSYYKDRYVKADQIRNYPGEDEFLKRPKKNRVYQHIQCSPEGNYIAYITNDMGQIRIYLYNVSEGKHKKIFKKHHKLQQITDYSFPVIAWHPSGKILAYVTEKKGRLFLSLYNIETKKKQIKELFYFEKVLSFDCADDGQNLVFSAVQKGQSDIFVFNIIANTSEQITNDIADDLYPRFVNNSRQIVFSSNRKSDTIIYTKKQIIPVNNNFDIFRYDYENKSDILTRLTNSRHADEIMPVETAYNTYFFLSDKNGIRNRYSLKYDSTISYIDTAIHYRYFSVITPMTNYSRNILDYDYSKTLNKSAEIIYKDKKYHLILTDVEKENESLYDKLPLTFYKKLQISESNRQDSIKKNKPIVKPDTAISDTGKPPEKPIIIEPPPDTAIIEVNNYKFEKEKYREQYESSGREYEKPEKMHQENDFVLPRPSVYFTSFYTDYVVSQLDFSYLSELDRKSVV